MLKIDKIYVAGSTGLVGSAVVRRLKSHGYKNILTERVELFDPREIDNFLVVNRPDTIIMCAARVGGIGANSKCNSGFLYDNLQMELNLINCARARQVPNFIFLGSSCIYPKDSKIPIKPDQLLSRKLEPTNEGYALAKICGIKLCEFIRREDGLNYHSVMPCNLYGPNDNYNLENCHVLPALIRKVHNCYKNNIRSIELWGTGNPLREFLYSDDVADAIIKLMEKIPESKITREYLPDIINVGSEKEISILNLLYTVIYTIRKFTNADWSPMVVCDTNKPDGVYSKLMDSSFIKSLGWSQKISLEEGLRLTYKDVLKKRIFD